MTEGDFTTSAARLHDAWNKLQLRLRQTDSQWRDVRRNEFHKTYLEPLEQPLARVLERISRLSLVFHQARQECAGVDRP